MKFAFLLEVDIDDTEHEASNAKRRKLGVQALTPNDLVENLVCSALTMKGITSATLTPATASTP